MKKTCRRRTAGVGSAAIAQASASICCAQLRQTPSRAADRGRPAAGRGGVAQQRAAARAARPAASKSRRRSAAPTPSRRRHSALSNWSCAIGITSCANAGVQRLGAAADAAVMDQRRRVRQQGGERQVVACRTCGGQLRPAIARVGRQQDRAPAEGGAGLDRGVEEGVRVAHRAAGHEDQWRAHRHRESAAPRSGSAASHRRRRGTAGSRRTAAPAGQPARRGANHSGKQRQPAVRRMHPVAEDADAFGRRRGAHSAAWRCSVRLAIGCSLWRSSARQAARPASAACRAAAANAPSSAAPVAAQDCRRGVGRDQADAEQFAGETGAEHRRRRDDGAAAGGGDPFDMAECRRDRRRQHVPPEYPEALDRMPQIRRWRSPLRG